MRLHATCWLIATLAASPASAGQPVPLAAHWASGPGTARIAAGDQVLTEGVQISLQLGPSFDCFAPLPAHELSLLVAGARTFLVARGSFKVAENGRARFELDPLSLAASLRHAYQQVCEETSTPDTCAEHLATLEPRTVRARLQARPHARPGGLGTSVRGRVELELIDPASESVAFRWSVLFRGVHDRVSFQPAFAFGFCGSFFFLFGSG